MQSCEYKKFKIDLNEGIGSQYGKFIESIILSNPSNEHNYLHVYKILHRYILPLDVFTWISQSRNGINEKFLRYVIDKKVKQDQFIAHILDVLRVLGFKYISINKLDPILEQSVTCPNEFHKHLVYELLTNSVYTSNSDREVCHMVSFIKERYTTLSTELCNLVYQLEFFADNLSLDTLLKIMHEKNMTYSFNPKHNTTHNSVYTWIKDNVVKGCNNEPVGFYEHDTCGNLREPSKDFNNYLKTLVILQKCMVTEECMV